MQKKREAIVAQKALQRTMIPKVYYARLNEDIKIYKTWNYIPEAMDCFREIVNEAKGAEVPLIVFSGATISIPP